MTIKLTNFFIQILKTWHLCSFVLCITCIGVVLVTVRTVAQALTNPRLVSDSENPEGSTVGYTHSILSLGDSCFLLYILEF